jgi:hypothetical protein
VAGERGVDGVAGAAARAVARERGATGVVDVRVGGGSGTGVGTLGEEELPTPLVAKLATVAAGVVWCRLWLASSLFPSFARFDALVDSCRERRLPLLPVTSVDVPLLPSKVEPPANGDRSR